MLFTIVMGRVTYVYRKLFQAPERFNLRWDDEMPSKIYRWYWKQAMSISVGFATSARTCSSCCSLSSTELRRRIVGKLFTKYKINSVKFLKANCSSLQPQEGHRTLRHSRMQPEKYARVGSIRDVFIPVSVFFTMRPYCWMVLVAISMNLFLCLASLGTYAVQWAIRSQN